MVLTVFYLREVKLSEINSTKTIKIKQKRKIEKKHLQNYVYKISTPSLTPYKLLMFFWRVHTYINHSIIVVSGAIMTIILGENQEIRIQCQSDKRINDERTTILSKIKELVLLVAFILNWERRLLCSLGFPRSPPNAAGTRFMSALYVQQ